MKLTLQDKLNIIDKNDSGIPMASLALEYSVGYTTVKTIIRQYRMHGKTFFKEKGSNNKYSAIFKLEIVKRVLNGESKTSIQAKTGINAGTIYNWCKKYDTLGYNELKSDLRGHRMSSSTKVSVKKTKMYDKEELEYLRERNQDLEMEIDLLKKLDALVQQRNQQQNKK